MSSEQEYPIYEFWIRFGDSDHNIVVQKMYRVQLAPAEVQAELESIKQLSLDGKRQGREGEYCIRDLDLEIVGEDWRFVREETWLCVWFFHSTLNTHLTDDELLESFERFVCRHEGKRPEQDDFVCLMGAEDRWRWKGPCRCEHCIAQGVVRIDH